MNANHAIVNFLKPFRGREMNYCTCSARGGGGGRGEDELEGVARQHLHNSGGKRKI